MRHNAAITVKFDHLEPIKLYLSGFGEPESIRTLLIRSMRGIRTYVKQDPETLAMQLTLWALKKTHVTFRPRERRYLWRYWIDFTPLIPTIKIRNISNGISETNPLFNFVGPARSRAVQDPQETLVEEYGKKRRGRPTNISRLPGVKVPAPSNVFEDGTIDYPDRIIKPDGTIVKK